MGGYVIVYHDGGGFTPYDVDDINEAVALHAGVVLEIIEDERSSTMLKMSDITRVEIKAR